MDKYDLEECDSKLYWKFTKAFEQLIPSVPYDLLKKLELFSCELGGIFRDKLKSDYIEEHQQAYAICRERQTTIDFIMKMLSFMRADNEKMLGCLRNSYKPPYDPEKFLYAWYFNHKDNPKCIDPKWIKKPENLKKCQDSFDYAMKFFNQVTDGLGAVFKFVGQYGDTSKAYICFYLPQFMGEFNLCVPQNMTKDYGYKDRYDDMKLSISYSEPGHNNIFWRCYDYETVCTSYTFEGLRNEFLAIIRDNPTMKLLKTPEMMVEQLGEAFRYKHQKYIDEPNSLRESEREFLEKICREMKEKNCDILETSYFHKECDYMLKESKKATIGDQKL